MLLRFRETGQTDRVELCGDQVQGPILFGHADPFGLVDPDRNGSHGSTEPYSIGPDTVEDWEPCEASDEERRRLREAGFRIDCGEAPPPTGPTCRRDRIRTIPSAEAP